MFRSVPTFISSSKTLLIDTIRTIRQWDDKQLLPFYHTQTRRDEARRERIDRPCVTFILLFDPLTVSVRLLGTNVQIFFQNQNGAESIVATALLTRFIRRRLCFVYFSVIFVGRKFMCLRSRDAERGWGVESRTGGRNGCWDAKRRVLLKEKKNKLGTNLIISDEFKFKWIFGRFKEFFKIL